MRVDMNISKNIKEPYAVIHAAEFIVVIIIVSLH